MIVQCRVFQVPGEEVIIARDHIVHDIAQLLLPDSLCDLIAVFQLCLKKRKYLPVEFIAEGRSGFSLQEKQHDPAVKQRLLSPNPPSQWPAQCPTGIPFRFHPGNYR